MIIELGKTLFSWFLIFPAVYSIGSYFDFFLRINNQIIKGIIRCAIGMAALSYLVVVLSALHLLNSPTLWGMLSLLFLLSLSKLGSWFDWLKQVTSDLKSKCGFLEFTFFLLFVTSFLALLMGALSPEIGGDALCYHLNIPKNFLNAGSIQPNYFDINSYFPMLLNNLYLIGLATGGVFSAKLFHLFMGLLLFITLKTVIFEETNNRNLSWFFALVLWLTPTIYNILSTAYNDGALTFYVFLALYLLIKAHDQMDWKLFFISGVMLGCAMAIKYIALFSFVGLLGVWINEIFKKKNYIHSLRNFCIWITGFWLSSGYWLIRNWFITGNPMFPFFAKFFGTDSYSDHYDQYGLGKNIYHFIFLFWDMFHKPTAFGSFGSRIGIFYFLFIPLMIIGFFYNKRSRNYSIFTFLFLIALFYTCQAHRYLLPALPAVCVASVLGIGPLATLLKMKLVKITTTGIGLGILSIYFAAGLFHYRYNYLLFSGYWTPQQYLLKMERTIPIANWINGSLPRDSKILIESETRQFYINRTAIRDAFLKRRTHYDQKNLTIAELNAYLKSLNFTHILMTYPKGESVNMKHHLAPLLNSALASEIYKVDSQNIRDEKYSYQLFQLN